MIFLCSILHNSLILMVGAQPLTRQWIRFCRSKGWV